MKAIRYHAFGGPEVLSLDEVPQPRPEAGEVLVRITSSGVNPVDISSREGRANRRPDFAFPATLGREAADVVEELGAGVSGLAVGDVVVLRAPRWSYAEYTAAPVASVYKLPKGLTDVEASTVVITYTTAWDAVVNKAGVQAGETVLIQGAAGGVGIAAVQIAKHLGATAIGTAGSDEKLAWAASQGMDHGVSYATDGYAAAVEDVTGGKGVNAVIDGVGGDIFVHSLECMAQNGRIAMFGAAAGRDVTINLARLFGQRLTFRGAGGDGATRADFEKILDLFAAGVLRPTVDRTYPLSEAAEAHCSIEERRVMGKVALTMG